MQLKRRFAGFFFLGNFRRLFGGFFGNFFGFHFALRLGFGGFFHFFGEFLGCCNHFGNRRWSIFVFLPLRNDKNNHNGCHQQNDRCNIDYHTDHLRIEFLCGLLRIIRIFRICGIVGILFFAQNMPLSD